MLSLTKPAPIAELMGRTLRPYQRAILAAGHENNIGRITLNR